MFMPIMRVLGAVARLAYSLEVVMRVIAEIAIDVIDLLRRCLTALHADRLLSQHTSSYLPPLV
jgi:hypothetical protein